MPDNPHNPNVKPAPKGPQKWAHKWSGKWCLITGASAGIGQALAKQLAAAGANLVLTARRTDRLQELAAELSSQYGVGVEIFSADLSQQGTSKEIFAFTSGKGIEIELLINNAGFGTFGYFHETDEDRLLEMIQVNCSAVVHLTRLYLPGMVARRHGDVLIVASVASFQAVPFISSYAATKAFDLIFAEGLAEEVRRFGVHVCALCPGSTNTEFQQVAGQPARVFRMAETAEKVARIGLEALARGKTFVVSGAMNRLMMESGRMAPRRFVAQMAARIMRRTEN